MGGNPTPAQIPSVVAGENPFAGTKQSNASWVASWRILVGSFFHQPGGITQLTRQGPADSAIEQARQLPSPISRMPAEGTETPGDAIDFLLAAAMQHVT
jgi:hypothetical protein